MTLVGKIFTVLILVLSIIFMAFSMMVFATHKNWKTNATKLQSDLAAANTALKDAKDALEREKTDLAREQAARKHALAALQVRATQSESRLAARQKELEDLTAAHSKVSEVAKVAQDRLADLEKETGDLRNTLRSERQRLDKMFLNVVDLTDKLNQAESLRQNLEEVNRQATQQMSSMKMVLDRNGLSPDATSVAHIPPKVDGVVLEVSDKDLIEISIG